MRVSKFIGFFADKEARQHINVLVAADQSFMARQGCEFNAVVNL